MRRHSQQRLRAEFVAHRHAEDFLDWIEANPRVFDWFVNLTRWAKREGITQLSGAYLRERFRHEARFDVESCGGFKFDNDHTPLLTRLIAIEEPGLAGMFAFTLMPIDAPD